jgi:tetratricopeptide (TPR) repeat protein
MRMQYLGAAAIAAVVALAGPGMSAADAQDKPGPGSAAQQFFEAGQYDDALKSIGEMREKGNAGPREAFLAAHVALKQSQNDRAKEEFERLKGSDDPVWRLVGESGTAAIENERDKSAELAAKAVEESKSGDQDDPARKLRNFHAFYQLGLARTRKEEWGDAAESFARAAELNPGFAYAHYYAGLSYSRVKRPDQVVKYFETFLKLAPKAPERSAVQSLLKAIRGN